MRHQSLRLAAFIISVASLSASSAFVSAESPIVKPAVQAAVAQQETVATEVAPSHQAAAGELIKIISPKETFVTAFMAGLQPMMQQISAAGKSPEQIANVKAAATALANKVADDPEFSAGMSAIYTSEFSEDELRGLTEFYQTTLGKKALSKLGMLMQKGGQLGQRVTQKHVGAFQAEVQKIMTAFPEE